MSQILVILVANVFHQLLTRRQAGSADGRKGLCIRSRIVDRDLDRDAAEIGSRVALDRVQLLRMRMAEIIEPELIVESDRIHHQRLSLPVSDRMPVLAGVSDKQSG